MASRSTKRDSGCRAGLGSRGPSPVGPDRPDERGGGCRSGRPASTRRRRPSSHRSQAGCHGRPVSRVHRAHAGDPGHQGRSTTPPGCSRSSGTATGSRQWSATDGSASIPATARMPRPTSRACSARPTGSRRARRWSTARWSRSTRRACRTSACSRNGLGVKSGAQPTGQRVVLRDRRSPRRGSTLGRPLATRLPGLRPPLPRRPVAPRGAARGAQTAPPIRPPRGTPGPLRDPRRQGRGSPSWRRRRSVASRE